MPYVLFWETVTIMRGVSKALADSSESYAGDYTSKTRPRQGEQSDINLERILEA
jgi:hypothetical protein